MLGGLAAGFLGAGLLGMLFGGGLFGGLGGLSSIFGLLLQIGLIVIVIRLAMSWWQRRHETASAYAGGTAAPGGPSSFRSAASGFGLGSGSAPLEILPADYEAFERLLTDIQAAWSNEDVAKLHTLATPEMVSYFTKDLEANRARNVVNKVSGTRLLAGRPRRSLARGRYRFRQRGDAVLDGRQDSRSLQRPAGRGQRAAFGSHRSLDLPAHARRQLGALGDPADLIAGNTMTMQGAAVRSAAPLFCKLGSRRNDARNEARRRWLRLRLPERRRAWIDNRVTRDRARVFAGHVTSGIAVMHVPDVAGDLLLQNHDVAGSNRRHARRRRSRAGNGANWTARFS